jgi:hypothetical protein
MRERIHRNENQEEQKKSNNIPSTTHEDSHQNLVFKMQDDEILPKMRLEDEYECKMVDDETDDLSKMVDDDSEMTMMTDTPSTVQKMTDS